MANDLRLAVKGILRDFGVQLVYHEVSAPVLDLDTGEKKETYGSKKVKKALMLAEVITEKFTYDLSYIAAGKNFVQGGFYSEGLRSVVILKSDVKAPTTQDQIEIEGVRYRVQSFYDNPNGVFGFNLVHIHNAG